MQWDEDSYADANGEFTDSGSVDPGYGSEADTYAPEAESGYIELDQADGESVQCDPSEDDGYEGSVPDYAPGQVAEPPETVNADSSQQYGIPDGFPAPVETIPGPPGGADIVITPDSGGAGTPPNAINPFTGQPGGADIVIAPPPSGAVGPVGPLFNSPVIMNDPNGARIVNEIQNSWDRANQAWTVPDGFRYGPR